MKIFITVGTQLPFPRLIKKIEKWVSEYPEFDVFAQTAEPEDSKLVLNQIEHKSFVEPEEHQKRLMEADLIVSHAGMGTIISALTNGKPVIILPRKADLYEHRNDHQLATAKQFKNHAGVHVLYDEDELPAKILELSKKKDCSISETAGEFAPSEITHTLRNFILEHS